MKYLIDEETLKDLLIEHILMMRAITDLNWSDKEFNDWYKIEKDTVDKNFRQFYTNRNIKPHHEYLTLKDLKSIDVGCFNICVFVPRTEINVIVDDLDDPLLLPYMDYRIDCIYVNDEPQLEIGIQEMK